MAKDLFGNKKPVAIESEEWWFNGRIIQKQNHPCLPKWISFSDDENSRFVEIHNNKKSAAEYALKNPCTNPKYFPHNYLGGFAFV